MIRNFQYVGNELLFYGDSEEECVHYVEQLREIFKKTYGPQTSLNIEKCTPSEDGTFWICLVSASGEVK